MIGCFALTSCSKPQQTAEIPVIFSSEVASNVPPIYQPFYAPGFTEEEAKTARDRLPFDSIAILRTGCFGTCPVYEMVLHRDGSAEFNAQAHLPKLGKFIGEARLHTYGRLCYLIESSHFSEMSSSYSANWTDDSTCIVTVTSGATVKAVSDYGRVGPIQLWAIQELLDAVKDEIEWKPTK
jgi:Domain of unknown function (DUF6438)